MSSKAKKIGNIVYASAEIVSLILLLHIRKILH